MFDESIICHYLVGRMSDEERRKLKQWQNQKDDNNLTLKDYESIWKLSSNSESRVDIAFNSWAGWLKLQNALSEVKTNIVKNKNKKKDHVSELPLKVKKFINE